MQAETATVRTYYLPDNTDDRVAKQTLTARFQAWPTVAGVFVAHPEFDIAGSWELQAEFTTADGQQVLATSAFPVNESSETPAIGDPAPASVTPTASDVEDLSHITTAAEPDPALYALSLHEAVAETKPFVVLFATPAYCVSFTCGPQVQELSTLRAKYVGQANFIHVEVFNDPHLIEGGRPTRRPSRRRRGMGTPYRALDFHSGRQRHSPSQVRAVHPTISHRRRTARSNKLRDHLKNPPPSRGRAKRTREKPSTRATPQSPLPRGRGLG